MGGAISEKVYKRYNYVNPKLVFYGKNIDNEDQWLFYNKKSKTTRMVKLAVAQEYYKYLKNMLRSLPMAP